MVSWPAQTEADLGQQEKAVQDSWMKELEGADVVINLAGESIAARRWSPAQKRRIQESRLKATRALVEAISRCQAPPKALISGSAVGFYGPCGDETVTEEAPPGKDFLSEVCSLWEREALRAEKYGVRVVLLRTGLVLGRQGGALPRMLLPFQLFLGGPLGSGRQWVPWIHIEDVVGLVRYLVDHPNASGPFNVTAPEPQRNREFSRIAAGVLRRPCWLPAPAAALRLALGEMADALLLSGQKAIPQRALDLGYKFRYVDLTKALENLLRS